jgi:hypothetical protein
VLHIFCHGDEASWNLGNRTCTPNAAGGFGLQLCREGLTLYNASLIACWKNRVKRIALFACARPIPGRAMPTTARRLTRTPTA